MDAVVLYKDGVASPPLHPIDAKGWMTLGWSEDPMPIAEPATVTQEDPEHTPAPKEKAKTAKQTVEKAEA